MTRRTRRGLLALLAGATAPLAGCRTNSRDPSGTRTDAATPPRTGRSPTPSERSPTATDPQPATDPGTASDTAGTATPGRLVLTRDDPSPGPTATVYPERLRSLLREAATTDGPLRVRAETPVYAPEPLLARLRTVRLESPDGTVDGRYEVAAEGGAYYEWRVGATPVESVPEGADVTPTRNLSPARRAFVDSALDRGGTLVSPETELGSWVRHGFVGGYVSRDGTTYRGRKLQQTDAAFFSREVWYVLSLTPLPEGGAARGTASTDGTTPTDTTATDSEATPTSTPGTPVTLRLRTVPDAVREVVDGLVGTYHRDRVTADLGGEGTDGAAVARFARETEGLLFHAAGYDVSVVAEGYP